ncbi:MAG: radical SAM protein [Candidatus Diapherotrites archaeon]
MDIPVTFQCNSKCLFCIYDTRQMPWLGNPPADQIKAKIKSTPEEECIGLTGGEPTLSPNLSQIVEFVLEQNPEREIFIVTNGRKFAEKEYAMQFKKFSGKNLFFGIPLLSHEEKAHDFLTGIRGSWNETIQGIKNLQKLGFAIEVRVLVCKQNYRDLAKTAEFIARELKGVFRVVFINLKYTGNAFINRQLLFVHYKTLVPFVQQAVEVLKKNKVEVKMFHFPLCTISNKYWEHAKGITKQEKELKFAKKCFYCKAKNECCRIWRSYPPLAGEEEFKPIRKITTKQ